MSDTRYVITGGSMANAAQVMNNHMSDGDQHTTTTEKYNYLHNEWSDVRNKPNFADASWKGVFADRASAQLVATSLEDTFVVLNDGDGKGALYQCIAITGTWDVMYQKLSDVDFASPEWGAILNTPTTVSGYGITDAQTHNEAAADLQIAMTYALKKAKLWSYINS